MKKKVLIIAAVIIANILAFSFRSHAQLVQKLEYPSDIKIVSDPPELIGDETMLTETKTGAKIECSSDKVHFKLYQQWQQVFKRYSWSWKTDRHGKYKEYIITISKDDANKIKEWATKNL